MVAGARAISEVRLKSCPAEVGFASEATGGLRLRLFMCRR